MNWQNSRSWGGVAPWFEWGQTPLFRRMPKLKWFKNSLFKTEYNLVNISDISKLVDLGFNDINKEILLEKRIINNKKLWVKVLWNWDINSKVSLKVSKISKQAKEKIEKAWWSVELV